MTNSLIKTSKIFESNIRIQILASLSVSHLTYSQLKKICQCTDGNISTHTKKLIEAKFIVTKKEFVNNKPQTTYYITDFGRVELKNYIALLNTLL